MNERPSMNLNLITRKKTGELFSSLLPMSMYNAWALACGSDLCLRSIAFDENIFPRYSFANQTERAPVSWILDIGLERLQAPRPWLWVMGESRDRDNLFVSIFLRRLLSHALSPWHPSPSRPRNSILLECCRVWFRCSALETTKMRIRILLSSGVTQQRTEITTPIINSTADNPPFLGIPTDIVVTPIDNASLSSSNTDGSKKSTDNLLH